MPHPRNGSKPARAINSRKDALGAPSFSPHRSRASRRHLAHSPFRPFGSEPKASYRSLLPRAYPPGFVAGLRCRESLAGSGQRRLQVIEHDSNRYLQVLLAKIGLGHGKTAGFK